MVSPHHSYPMIFIVWWISHCGAVCGPRLRCSLMCHALIVVLLATEHLLLPVRCSGTVCITILLTVCHWRHSTRNWKLFCFLHHFHDYICLFGGHPWGFYLGHFINFLCMNVCMYVCIKECTSRSRGSKTRSYGYILNCRQLWITLKRLKLQASYLACRQIVRSRK